MPLAVSRLHTHVDGLDHPEGLCVHPDGSIYAGGEAGQIYRITRDGKRVDEVARAKGGFMLGVAIDPTGEYLVACDLKQHCLWRLELKSGRMEKFARGAGRAHPFEIPNHLAFAANGDLYVSDSGVKPHTGKVLRFDPGGRGIVWHAGPIKFANGLALDEGEKHLYVTASFLPGVEKIAIKPDGTAGKRSVAVRLPGTVPDGLAFDAKGNLYITCYAPSRIYRLSPEGKLDILVEDWTAHALASATNIAFGGEKFDQLFAANLARWHITRVDLRVKGLPLACHRRGATK